MHGVHSARSRRHPWRAHVHSLLLAAGIAVLGHGRAIAGEAPTNASVPTSSITLGALFAAAWHRQPEAQALSAREEAARARREVANSWTAEPPAVELSTKTDRINRNAGSREHEVGIAIPLWLPGERDGVRSLADAESHSVSARVAAAKLRISAAVRDAYWSWERARIEVRLATDRLESARALAADVARRVGAGDLSRADAHQAQGNVAAALGELAERRHAWVAAQQALRAITGVTLPESANAADEPALGVVSVPFEVVPPLPPDLGSIDSTHPAVTDLLAQAEVARRALDLARTQTRGNPEVLLATTRDRGQFGDAYQQTVTLGVRIPLGADARYRSKIASASAEALEVQSRMQLERERVLADLDAARRQVDLSKARLDAALERARLARETRGFYERSFNAGETDLPMRLRIEFEATEAERQAGRARIDHAQSISSLRQALGLLTE